MRTFNPLSLNTDKDEPTFINPEGTKWWLISYGSHLDEDGPNKEDGAVYRAITKEGGDAYVVIHGGEAILESNSLENCLFKIDENYLRRTK